MVNTAEQIHQNLYDSRNYLHFLDATYIILDAI